MADYSFKYQDHDANLSSIYTADELKVLLDSMPKEARDFINGLVGIFNSITDGSSGADNIAMTAVSGLSGATVQAIVESLKTALDEAVLGAIADGSLTTAKYANGSVTAAKCAADVATQAELDTEASSRSSADTTLQGNIDNLAGAGRTTETVKGNADAISAHQADYTDYKIGITYGVVW